jgi:death-on-curing protein
VTRFLSLGEVLKLHRLILEATGGSDGLRDLGLLESSLGQPRQTFGGTDLYPTLVAKAAALGFSLIKNHPFVDGNKRVGHAAVEAFLMLNGFELNAPVDDAEREILGVAAGQRTREELEEWLARCIVPLDLNRAT